MNSNVLIIFNTSITDLLSDRKGLMELLVSFCDYL